MARGAKILVLLAAVDGGAQKSSLLTAAALHGAGYEVSVLMPEAIGPFLGDLPASIAVIGLGTRDPRKVVAGVRRYLKEKKPQLVLANQQHMIACALIARALAGSDTKIIGIQRNNLSALAAQSSHPLVRLLPLFARLFWRYADAIVGVSQGVCDDLEHRLKLPAQKVRLIHNPVVFADLAALAREPARHPWLHDKTVPVAIGLGALAPHKSFDTLIRALAIVRGQRDLRLVIFGEGPERAALQALIASLDLSAHVDLPGFTPNPYAELARADLFVLSSRYEGLPRALIEAMAVGTSCVSTDCESGPDEILCGGKLGALVPPGDAPRMAEAMLATLASPQPRENLRQRALDFSEERSLENYTGLIEEILRA